MKNSPPLIHCGFFPLQCKGIFKAAMKFSWTSLKISLAGAKLSHLVQKDKIWDHGSMAEQARIIFYLVQKAKGNGNVDSLKKQCSVVCFEKLKKEIEEAGKQIGPGNPVIKELAIIEVLPGKNNKPDMFCALIKGHVDETPVIREPIGQNKKFVVKWSFVRQGEWWMLDEVKP